MQDDRLVDALLKIAPSSINKVQEKDLATFKTAIKNANPTTVKVLEDKLLGGFLFLLMRRCEILPGLRTQILHCISAIVSICTIKNAQAFLRLYSLTCDQIFNSESCSLDKNLPEELKEAVMTSLKCYSESLSDAVSLQVYSVREDSSSIHILSQGVLLASQIAKNEKSVTVRLSALEFLLQLSRYSSNNFELREKVADVFVSYVPGLVNSLTDIIYKEELVNHKVLVLAIRCWGHIMLLALRDFADQKTVSSSGAETCAKWLSSIVISKDPDKSGTLRVLSNPLRTRDWASAAAELLQIQIKKVAAKSDHPHSAVRREMSRAFGSLIKQSSQNLGRGAGPLLDALMSLSQDQDANVRRETMKLLAGLSDQAALRRLAQDRLPDVMNQLSQSVSSGDAQSCDRALFMLNGYLVLFDGVSDTKEGPCIINNPLLLRKLIPALRALGFLQLKTEILHTHDIEPTDFQRYGGTYRETLIKGKATLQFLDRVCEFLAKFNFDVSVSILIEDFNTKNDLALESISVLNLVVRHLKNPDHYLVNDLVKFYLSTNNGAILNWDDPPNEMAMQVMKVVLALDGIASLAHAIGSNFSKYLLDTLYPVVERIGSRFSLIRAAGICAGEAMGAACGAKDVGDLIESNVDYLTHHIVLRLRRSSDQSVLHAVRIVTGMCPAKTLLHFQHIVSQILLSSTIELLPSHITPYLRVFKAFVLCAASIVPKTDLSEPSATKKTPGMLLREHIEKKEKEEGLLNDDCSFNEHNSENLKNVEENAEGIEEKKKPELHIEICVKTVARCLHYLPMCTDTQKVLCLEVLDKGFRAIGRWEDELLPLVHQVWSPLVQRFDPNTKPLIISRSFSLLVTLCILAKDFIRHRTLTEVLPGLCEALTRLAQWSKSLKTSRTDLALKMTQDYKLQRQLLTGLAPLTLHLSLRERDTDSVIEAAIPYLSRHQPPQLQECAVQLYKSLLTYNACLVAYRLEAFGNDQEYSENVNQVLTSKIQDCAQ